MYIRKTIDVYSIVSNYGWGFEETCCCDSYQEAKQTLKDYRSNQPEYSHKLKKSREKINVI